MQANSQLHNNYILNYFCNKKSHQLLVDKKMFIHYILYLFFFIFLSKMCECVLSYQVNNFLYVFNKLQVVNYLRKKYLFTDNVIFEFCMRYHKSIPYILSIPIKAHGNVFFIKKKIMK